MKKYEMVSEAAHKKIKQKKKASYKVLYIVFYY